MLQKWDRLYSFVEEYQQLVYDYYSKNAVAYLCTYYSLSKDNTVWDDVDLMGGAYEDVGDLSGIRWNKILLLPVYFLEEITTAIDGQETGVVKENETSLVIPSSYGIEPLEHDMIKFEQSYLRPDNDIYPVFRVSGRELSVNTDRKFWKLKLSTLQSRTLDELESQVYETNTFFEYDKNIHNIDDASSMTRLLNKNETLRENLKVKFDGNSGFYLL